MFCVESLTFMSNFSYKSGKYVRSSVLEKYCATQIVKMFAADWCLFASAGGGPKPYSVFIIESAVQGVT